MSQSKASVASAAAFYGKVLYDFNGQAGNQLTLKAGESVKIITKGESGGWSRGEDASGNIGFFPSDYVEIITENVPSLPLPSQQEKINLQENNFSGNTRLNKLDLNGKGFALHCLPGTTDSSPLWHQHLFLDLFVDKFVDKTNHSNLNATISTWTRIQHSIQIVYSLLSDYNTNDFETDELRYGHNLVVNTLHNACSNENAVPAETSDANRMFLFLATHVNKIKDMRIRDVIMLPIIVTTDTEKDHVVILIIRRVKSDTDEDYSLTVVNTGEGTGVSACGLQYHAVSFNNSDGRITRNIAFEITNISNHKLVNSTFWFLLLRSTVYPEAIKLSIKELYERLLPYLSTMPLLMAMKVQEQSMVFRNVPVAGDKSYILCVLEAMYHMLHQAGLSPPQVETILLIVRWNAIRCVKNDVQVKRGMLSMGEVEIIRIAVQLLAAQAGRLGQDMQETPALNKRLRKLLECVCDLDGVLDAAATSIGRSNGVHVSLAKFQLSQEAPLKGVCSWLWFGRLRRDADVEELAGTAMVPPINRPVELTLVPDRVQDFYEAAIAMRHALNLCVLLANQRAQISNSYTLRLCLIEHLFVRVIPLPLPLLHADRRKRCFWHSQPMRYETQADLLRLLNMLCRHFSAASLSVKVTRSGDAIRILTLSCMSAVCDALLRKVACDVPSQSSLHYSGMAPGPIRPFGFDVGNFRVESEYLQFNTPETSVARTMVLDYFQELRSCIPEENMMFRFENGNVLGKAEKRFIDQICLQVGFERGHEVQYITGEDSIILDHYPDIGFFRDLVFMFKLMMVPTSDALPDLKAWTPADAALKWTSVDDSFVVTGFGRKLECTAPMMVDDDSPVNGSSTHADGFWTRLWKLLSGASGKPRAPLSKANPSVLVGERIDTEDDVLHLRVLPDFDGTLGARDCELMLQYLTAPYLRIPLLLNFFSCEARMKSLRCKALQDVLDAALFEPGRWQIEHSLAPPEMIPSENRRHISTPVGLLFNELIMSPKAILTSVQKLLEQSIDLDSGRYNGSSSETILYVLRLVVRVEGYVLFLLKNNAFLKSQRKSKESGEISIPHGAYYESCVRGLDCDEDVISATASCRAAMRKLLVTKMFKILVRWIRRAKEDGQVLLACMLHAHISYIFRNIEVIELDARTVFTILGSQIYLFNNYIFDIDIKTSAGDSASKRSTHTDYIGDDLGIPIVELFDMHQRNRRKIFDWLTASPEDRNKVMDAIVHLIKEGEMASVSRNWVSINRPGLAGKFIPDNEMPDFEKLTAKARKNFEAWLRETTTVAIDTEINVQLGEFTVKRNTIAPLGDEFTKMSDFVTVFANATNKDCIQSAYVQQSTNRHWIRLVGLGFDLQLWNADTRTPLYTQSIPYESCSAEWLRAILDPWLPLVLPDMKLFATTADLGKAGMTILCGVLSTTKGKDNAPESPTTGTWKEVVIYRYPRVIHVFNVVEYGRRFYRTLVFSSSMTVTMHDLPPGTVTLDGRVRQYSGQAASQVEATESLVILRDVPSSETAKSSIQTFIPGRFLRGLMPQSLLEQYQFWQNEDDSLTGYMIPESTKPAVARSILTVKLIKDKNNTDTTGFCNSVANAFISRSFVLDNTVRSSDAVSTSLGAPSMGEAYDSTPDPSKPSMNLVNLLAVFAAFGSKVEQNVGYMGGDTSDFENDSLTQHALVKVLLRLDSLSHVQAWSKSEPTISTGLSIDLIELPRLRLTFERVVQPDGTSRYMCAEQSGVFLALSSLITEAEFLLQGLPHAVVLMNTEQELFLLLPATSKPVLLNTGVDKFSYNLSLVHGDEMWLERTGESTYFIYPIHVSGSFLLAKSVSSILYLLLFRLISHNYKDACRLAKSCICDRTLSPQEQQFFHEISSIPDTINPNVYGFRLTLFFASFGCSESMSYPWNVPEDMHNYHVKWDFISTHCRLAPREEHFVMSKIAPGSDGIDYAAMTNRENLVRASFESKFAVATTTAIMYPDQLEVKSILDETVDFESLDASNPKFKATLAKMSISRYNRPEECTGPQAIAFLLKVINEGIDLRGRKNSLGFMFLYDLMTNHLGIKILPDENAHKTGAALLRLLQDESASSQPQPMAILRVMGEQPDLCAMMPIFEDKRKLKLPSFTGVDIFQAHVKNVGSLLLSHMSEIKKERLGFRNVLPYSPPKFMSVSEIAQLDPKSHKSRLWYTSAIIDYNRSKVQLSLPPNLPRMEKLVTSQDVTAFATIPLGVVGLGNFIEMKTLTARNIIPVKADASFDVLHHPSSRSHIARTSLTRLQQDVRDFANDENGSSAPVLKLIGEIDAQADKAVIEAATKKMAELGNLLRRLKDRDSGLLKVAVSELRDLSNSKPSQDAAQNKSRVLAHFLLQRAGMEPTLEFDFLASTVAAAEKSDGNLCRHNIELSQDDAASLTKGVLIAMMTANRISQTNLALVQARTVFKLLNSLRAAMEAGTPESVQLCNRLRKELVSSSSLLALTLVARREYAAPGQTPGTFELDPRLLLFEFSHSILLRRSQVQLVLKLLADIRSGRSACHQMIMGAGKTTVVGPLLAMLLSNEDTLVMEIVPASLLDFSAGVLRERCSAIINRPVFTFTFDRYQTVTQQLVSKLLTARQLRAVVVSTPTCVKSFMLKFLEICHLLSRQKDTAQEEKERLTVTKLTIAQRLGLRPKPLRAPFLSNEEVRGLRRQAELCIQIFDMFKTGVEIMDEVDLLLHPLRSELNWPLGDKFPLDFTKSGERYHGMRWLLPGHLLDALFFCSGMPITADIADSKAARSVLDELKVALEEGFRTLQLQRTPHVILLSPVFYNTRLLSILSRWLLLWLRGRKLPELDDNEVLEYLVRGVGSKVEVKSKVSNKLGDDHVKMLNLGHAWLTSFLPFVMQKIDRVHFGLLQPDDVAQLEREGIKIPSTRKLMAVPFVAKDVPSRATEFSHPDVLIGLTILAFRFEGLRKSDFRIEIRHLLETMEDEMGSYDQRLSYQRFEQWILHSGRFIRGSKRRRIKSVKVKPEDLLSVSTVQPSQDLIAFEGNVNVFSEPYSEDNSVWPLHLIDVNDKEQMKLLYPLLSKLPHAVMYFLEEIIFPEMLAHQKLKLSTCGQELGGEILFGRRIGFSGTPSDILPVELGHCQYERGSDGKVVHYLSSPDIVQFHTMEANWTVRTLLDFVAKADPPLHALIDTGALITGMSNIEVAEYLLSAGLETMKGVVFLDAQDRLMVLLRKGRIVVKLHECGLAWGERFSFYDHIHTTGMDIKQAVDACAALTLGKDMVFRDYAQGAFRMRGIGAGQTIKLIAVPEILQRIKMQVAAGSGVSVLDRERRLYSLGDSKAQFLKDVISWLIVNSMRVDGIQFNLLCEQSVANIWRKRAYRRLLADFKDLDSENCSSALMNCLQVFRERVDHAIENTIPQIERYSERIAGMISNSGFMLEPEDAKEAYAILSHIVEEERKTNAIKAQESQQVKLLVISDDAEHEQDDTAISAEQSFNREQVQEQEQEQEQEKEQEKEKEKEEERVDEIVEEDFVRVKYTREEEQLVPWPLAQLARDPVHGNLGFYPLSNFAVFKNASRPHNTIKFPEFLWVSRNYYSMHWTARKQHRRLKNVIVMVDWQPTSVDASALDIISITNAVTQAISDSNKSKKADSGKSVIFKPLAFTAEQEALLVRCFELFDADEDGYLKRDDILQVAEVMALRDADSLNKMMACLKSGDTDNSFMVSDATGKLSFSGFRELVRSQVQSLQYLTQEDAKGNLVSGNRRFCSVLCLAEGEHLRRALHLYKQGSRPGGTCLSSTVEAGIWTLGTGEGLSTTNVYETDWNRLLLGSSERFRLPSYPHYSAMRNCLRFLNNDIDLLDEDVTMLLRVLSGSSCENRLAWWMDVRASRRRRQVVWDGSAVSVGAVFGTVDEYHFMEYKALVLRVKAALRDSGMLVFDAFRAFNSSHSGVLSCSELYGGLDWLGIRLTPNQVYDLVRRLSIECEGMVSYKDFRRAFQSSAEEMESQSIGSEANSNFIIIPPKQIPELTSQVTAAEVATSNIEVTAEMLKYIKIKVKPIPVMVPVWSTQGSLSAAQISVWSADLSLSVMHSGNRARICLGHYAVKGLSNPLIGQRVLRLSTVEVTDTAALRLIQRSKALSAVLGRVLPHPIRFKSVWHMTRGAGQSLYAWRAVPPESFVALGMVCSTSEEPPDVSCMRCVPLKWCTPVKVAPLKIWDDSGAGGGRPGSVWLINSLDLIAWVAGHEAPKDIFYEFNADRFFLDESMLANMPTPLATANAGSKDNNCGKK